VIVGIGSEGFCRPKLFFLAGIYVSHSTNNKLAGNTNKGKGGGNKEAIATCPAHTPAVVVTTAEGSLPLYAFLGSHIVLGQYYFMVSVFSFGKG
jgi:hypothetical protein